MQGSIAVRVGYPDTLDLGGDVEEAFRTEEEAVLRPVDILRKHEILIELRMRDASAETEVPGASFGVEAPGNRDCLEQRGFARAVLADEERDLWVQLESVQIPYRRQRERIPVERRDLV